MNEDVKREWVSALRSGQYSQGTQYLRRDDDYCCLGVLCDLMDSAGWVGLGSDGQYGYLNDERTRPLEVIDWAGLSDEDPDIVAPCDCKSATESGRLSYCNGTNHRIDLGSFNDTGHSFVEIADLIEAQL
jgi:hypothetical protein